MKMKQTDLLNRNVFDPTSSHFGKITREFYPSRTKAVSSMLPWTRQTSRTVSISLFLSRKTPTRYTGTEEIQVDEDGIRKHLQKTNPIKVTDPDCIPARILKYCASALAPVLTIIFNQSLQEGIVQHAKLLLFTRKVLTMMLPTIDQCH